MNASRSLPLLAAVVVLSGHVTDKTTGQPLGGVHVVADGPQHASATTSGDGAYRLSKLRAGRYTLTLSSDDVPPQRFEVTVRGAKPQTFDAVACSTTLDYACNTGL